jgi:lipoprotein-releasing system permease protein
LHAILYFWIQSCEAGEAKIEISRSVQSVNIELYIARRLIRAKNKGLRFSRPVVNMAIVSITLGLAVMLLANCIVTGFKNNITGKLIGIGGHIQIANLDNNYSFETNPIDIYQPTLQGITEAVPEIVHMQEYATKHAILKTDEEIQGVLLKGVGKDFDWGFFEAGLLAGSIPDFQISPKEVLVSKIIANRLRLRVGDSLHTYYLSQVRDPEALKRSRYPSAIKVRVSGIYETGIYEFDEKLIITSIQLVQRMYSWQENQISGFEVMISSYKKLESALSGLQMNISSDLYATSIKEQHPEIFEWLPTVDLNSHIINILMIVVSLMAMSSTLLILILERVNTIGILKAVGMNNYQLQRMFLYQAGFIIGRGITFGNLLGLGLCFLQWEFGFVKMDQESYYLSEVPIEFNLFSIMMINLATFGICAALMLLPSLLVRRITPLQAIRLD